MCLLEKNKKRKKNNPFIFIFILFIYLQLLKKEKKCGALNYKLIFHYKPRSKMQHSYLNIFP